MRAVSLMTHGPSACRKRLRAGREWTPAERTLPLPAVAHYLKQGSSPREVLLSQAEMPPLGYSGLLWVRMVLVGSWVTAGCWQSTAPPLILVRIPYDLSVGRRSGSGLRTLMSKYSWYTTHTVPHMSETVYENQPIATSLWSLNTFVTTMMSIMTPLHSMSLNYH